MYFMKNRAHFAYRKYSDLKWCAVVFLSVASFLFCPSGVTAQCPYGGINYGDVTPAGVGQTVELLNFVWGGDQYTLQATAGCIYTVTTCGTSWDTQITVFDETLAVVDYSDDFCGLQSQVTFLAGSTGAYTIQVNTWPCGINFTGAEYFAVTLVSCPGMTGCTNASACNYDPGATSDDGSCCFDSCVIFDMIDTFGDGWNGATYTITNDGGTIVATGSLDTAQSGDGSSVGTDIFCLPDGCYTVIVGGGTFDSEITWNVSGDVDNPVGGPANLPVQFEINGACPPPIPPCYDANPSGCPNIDVGPDLAIDCTDPCSTMQVNADVFETGASTSYEICAIDYNPPFPFTAGTPFSIGIDDVYTGVIDLPFNFCFFGSTYSQLVVGSNNVLSFDLTNAGGFCPWAFSALCPNPALPLNSIMGPYHDIDPAVCGDAKYAVLGTPPCRSFVVNFDNVCHFQCNSLLSTTQIVLYETTNVIEVYIEDKPTCYTWNSGNALIGIQNATGTVGYVAQDRNTGPWTASLEAWRFTPDGVPNFVVDWYEAGTYFASGTTVDVCPGEPTQTYLAEATYTNCDGSTVVVADNVTVVCQAIMLPVELVEFNAVLKEPMVECSWDTYTELNNDYFTLQRSRDGHVWTNLGQVEGAGTTTVHQQYYFTDSEPLYGLSYYRLKQTDFDGSTDFSEIRSVERDTPDEIFVFPNPNSGQFILSINDPTLKLRITDERGREIQYQSLEGGIIDVIGASTGVYFAELFSGQKSIGSTRFQVVKD
jgi:hypothetical protein